MPLFVRLAVRVLTVSVTVVLGLRFAVLRFTKRPVTADRLTLRFAISLTSSNVAVPR
ncbi:MAG: hypothetical protein ABR529_13930 [Actinomycetota bacterium]